MALIATPRLGSRELNGSRMIGIAGLAAAVMSATACASLGVASGGPQPVFAAASGLPQQGASQDYRIGPLDKLNITVFQVKDLTLEEVQVDGSGRVFLPLIGSVVAAGKTTQELSTEIADRLRGQFLQSPQVAVWVAEAISQKVTVDGSVVEPGVYAMSGPTTLLQAVAMAKGPDLKYANLGRVAVFRTINGQRNVAVFDLKAIRAGKASDPVILGNDIVVVEGSQLKGTLREVLGALPVLAIFRPY
ncbi:MAG: polysaccharide biosynthesis/export family protein [Caulobacter sp.]|nr:polysaccharide biosynthesis/export family protein [Caulobacter sp.]